MKVHLIHGIHTEGLTAPIENLIPYLKKAGYKVAYPEYGWVPGVGTELWNPRIVGILEPYIEEDDILIGHSNGCAIIYELLKRGVPAHRAVFINAALERVIVRPPQVRWIDIYYNAGDDITELAKIAAEMHLTDRIWGEMGHAGPLTLDPNIVGIDATQRPLMPKIWGHSDFLTVDHQVAYAPFLIERLIDAGRPNHP